MVITNTGGTDLPLASLRVDGKKISLGAGSWGTETLPPGGCLVTRSEGSQGEGVGCSQAGATAWLDNPSSGIFKEAITITYGGQVAGSCGKDAQTCAVGLP